MPGRVLRALGLSSAAGALDEVTGRRPRRYALFERVRSADEETAGVLLGPLPPPQSILEVPHGHAGSKLFTERVGAREYVLKNSPVLFHTESWIETLLTPREWLPPSILIFVVILVSLVTWGTLTYPSPTLADDRIHSTMYGFISLLIVFRTSQAYARWWEGRTLWGSIVNSTRNLASNAACYMNDDARYTRAIICTITFAYSTKQLLRGRRLDPTEVQGLFTKNEIDRINSVEHIPMLMMDEIRRMMKFELREQLGSSGSHLRTSDNWDMIISADIKALVDALGACERIAKTPMPFGYLAQLRIFILIWLITWPLGLTLEYGWATIPLVSVCAWMMLKIEEIAVQCESPFGMDANDLPLDTICVTIERNLLEILRRAEYLRTHDDLVDVKSFRAYILKP
ncbi:Bestrophin, RFP-TM, chloride channel-domain-containing protein [Pavlovales sp. CCMP2436]|nr:Bestrophin, RFP-TM, chloride channel-domain-containing protein [Pavlovales sp. CCMP2436]